MISIKEVYNVVAAIVPLYVPMILAYGSICWWKIFTPEQCSGVNRFVAVFAVPFLNFQFVAFNNPYNMNLKFIAADTLQKLVIMSALFLSSTLTKFGSFEWNLTLFSLASLPNALVVGVPLITAMYGDSSAPLMTQILVMQNILWFPLILFLYEYRAAKCLISKQFPQNGDSVTSLAVDSHVTTSLNGNQPLQADAEMKENAQVRVPICSSHTCNEGKNEPIDKTVSPKEIEDREVGIVDGLQYIEEGNTNKKHQTPLNSIMMIRLILPVVWKNLIRNPNTYASVLGLAWSLISFRWNIKMASIVNGSIVIVSRTGTGMAMFSLGLFMALQPKALACGKTWAATSLIARFLIAPAVIAVTSMVIGIRGDLLRVAIVQAALPQAIVSFVYAKEYNLHADILSTAVIFGTVISLPVTIIYFVLLGL